MIRRTLSVGVDRFDLALGAVVCRDLPISTATGPAQIRRGTAVDQALLDTLSHQPGTSLDVVLPDPGEVSQDEASRDFARAVIGPELKLDSPHQGQCVVHAATRGVLRVRASRVARVNRRDAILLVTALDGRIVEPGDNVAIVKATRLWTAGSDLDRSRRAAGHLPILRVAPFVARKAAFLAGPRIRPRNAVIASDNLRGLLASVGIELTTTKRVAEDPSEIADFYRDCLDQGIDVVLIGGSLALDPEDPFIVAIDRLAGRLVCRGAPIDPGTMFWVAYLRSTVVFGLASCELYGRRSVLDLILPYAAAQEPVTQALLAELGYGGILEQTFSARRS